MNLRHTLAALAGLLAVAPATVSATTFVKYGDRTEFRAAAGAVRNESFNSLTSDVDLTTPFHINGFTMFDTRKASTPGTSFIDAKPFNSGGSSINGSSFVMTSVYELPPQYSAFLTLVFDSPITSFGGNFTSGASGFVTFLIDGQIVQRQTEPGGFFGFVSDTPFTRLELHSLPGSGTHIAFDDLVFSAAGVPEPAAWGMMIGGFGFAGAAIRRRRGAPLATA